jgi:hypothetical protein
LKIGKKTLHSGIKKYKSLLKLVIALVDYFKSITAIFALNKRFCSQMRQNDMKFGLDRKIEFKKSLELYIQNFGTGQNKS